MMVLALLIVAIALDAPGEARYPGATELSCWTFSESADVDFDGWPDGWTRQRGPGFPHYNKVFISSEPAPAGDRCLRMEMDGQAAGAYTPPVPIEPLSDYVVEGWVNTEGLGEDRAYLSLTVLDERRRIVDTFLSEKVGRAPGWRQVRMGPVSPASENGRFAVVGVHVEPHVRADLQGAARFADLWLGRLPRMTLSAGPGLRLFIDPRQVSVDCAVSGLTQADATVHFELYDALDARLADAGHAMKTEASLATPPGIRKAQWQPPLPGPGLYRVRATVKAGQQIAGPREILLTVIVPQPGAATGEFGWSLSGAGRRLPPSDLAVLMAQAGVTRVKSPLPLEPQGKEDEAGSLALLIQRLSSQGIRWVGVLDRPPDQTAADRGNPHSPSVADWLSQDPKTWAPAVEAMVARFGDHVAWWQLGRDDDAGFVGYPRLAEKLDQVQAEFQRAGRSAHLGVAWAWTAPLPQESRQRPSSLRFVSLAADPPLTPDELTSHLGAGERAGLARWVTLQALPKDEYSREDRTADLVRQMVAAKQEGAEAIFLADPLSSDRGLLTGDGSPGELFLPWRTTALLLGGAKPAGSLLLPQGSPNRVFLRGNDAVMLVWNPRPTRETLLLGKDLRGVDLWGRETPLAKTDDGQAVSVTAVPSFVVGMDRQVVQWHLGLALAQECIPAVLGRPHANELIWKNSSEQDVEGTLTLAAPEGWKVDPPQISFRLSGGEVLRRAIEITAPPQAQAGLHVLRADFEIRAERPCRFSVCRPVRVGLDDVRVEIDAELDAQGDLEVRQRLVNQSDRAVRFRCQLFAPDRRRLTAQASAPAHASDVQAYRLADGKELAGKTLWLQAQETDGPRVLNYRFVVEE